MHLNLYDTTMPPIITLTKALQKILKKGEDYAKENNIDPMDMTNAKLAPDMLPLTFQIVTIARIASSIPARAAGHEPLDLEFKLEMTFDELQERLAIMLEYVQKAKREEFEGREDDETEILGTKLSVLDYMNEYAMPNVYFHLTTAYDILRHKGVQIGKKDFLGGRLV